MNTVWKILTAIGQFVMGLFEKAASVFQAPHPLRGPMMHGRTRDVAITYRMGAGYAGDVNRTHPASIEPVLIGASDYPDAYGQAVLVDAANAVRKLVSGDSAITDIYGVTIRPFPVQQSSGSNFGAATLGAAVPPTAGVLDVLKDGYIMVNLPFGGTTKKGDPCYVRIAATSGNHIQGAFEAAADGGNSIKVLNAKFNGIPDASNNVEIIVTPARNAA